MQETEKTSLLDETHWQKKHRDKTISIFTIYQRNKISWDLPNLKGSLTMRYEKDLCDLLVRIWLVCFVIVWMFLFLSNLLLFNKMIIMETAWIVLFYFSIIKSVDIFLLLFKRGMPYLNNLLELIFFSILNYCKINKTRVDPVVCVMDSFLVLTGRTVGSQMLQLCWRLWPCLQIPSPSQETWRPRPLDPHLSSSALPCRWVHIKY